MARGGYQRPTSPAPVSGPGALARRTDGGAAQPIRRLPNAGYGESAEYESLQQSAPLSAAPPVPTGSARSGGGGGDGGAALVGLLDPTQRPGEPVTAGAPMGAGMGPEGLGLPDPNADVKARLYALYTRFPTADLRELLEHLE